MAVSEDILSRLLDAELQVARGDEILTQVALADALPKSLPLVPSPPLYFDVVPNRSSGSASPLATRPPARSVAMGGWRQLER